MKRIKIVGLCLVAVLALVAIASATASAQTAEYGQCLAKKKGNYSNSNCTGSDPGAGKYEWYPGGPKGCVAKRRAKYTTRTCTNLGQAAQR